MGEVYKARDTRLDRTVAIKVLPDVLATDPQFRDRFDREARIISSLVMQYLEGETLARRLERGAVPLSEALTIAIQIASALDYARRAGITHRDLKPGNVMLMKSGAARQGPPHARLLDFGLAKAGGAGQVVAQGFSPANLSALPTTPPNLTAEGTILGTFQYMAPEQLEGKDADARTDIFAFGAVVYEMLTGKKAFEGKSHASLIGAIMHAEPPPIGASQPLTPPLLDRIVRKCLAKEPGERWQNARDLLDNLKWISDASSQTIAAPAAAKHAAVWARPGVAWSAAGLLLLIAIGLTATLLLRSPRADPPEPQTVQFDVVPPGTPTRPLDSAFEMSPDGRQLAFVAISDNVQHLWIRPLDRTAAQMLPGTDGARCSGRPTAARWDSLPTAS